MCRVRDWIEEHPGEPQSRLIEAGLTHPRLIRQYLDHMAASGFIKAQWALVACSRGRRRCKVWAIAPPEPMPQMSYEEIEALLDGRSLVDSSA
jgi:hypothetical protein